MTRSILFVFAGLATAGTAAAQTPAPPPPPEVAVLAPIPDVPPLPFDLQMAVPFDLALQMELEMEMDVEAMIHELEDEIEGLDLPALVNGFGTRIARAVDVGQDVGPMVRAAMEAHGGYDAGLDALHRRDYELAIDIFDREIGSKNGRRDAAHYWKAFAEFRLGQTEAALETLEGLRQNFPDSRYLADARVLESEVKRYAGQAIDPATVANDEIKLLAIQGLRNSSEAVPLLEQVLSSANALTVKRRALYVLALSDDPRAEPLLVSYAKGAGNPDLQIEAIRYLVSRRSQAASGALLRDVYSSSTDPAVKREVINALVATAHRNGRDGRQTNSGPAASDLAALYASESDPDLKRRIMAALSSIGAIDSLRSLITTESDVQLRARAIRSLAGRRAPDVTRTLLELYDSSSETAIKEAVVSALAGQKDTGSLIALARRESDTEIKTRIVRHIAGLAEESPEAAAFLADVLR